MIRLFSQFTFAALLFITLSSFGPTRQHSQDNERNAICLLKDGQTRPIWIKEYQNSINATGTQEFYHTLINNTQYEAVRIGEYLWMNKNLNDSLPTCYDQPWNQGTPWIGTSSRDGVTQQLLNKDMDRLKIDKSQFQIDIKDFHNYYGRYYTRTEIEHFKRKNEGYVSNKKNLYVYEGAKDKEADWKVPVNRDFRQLFAMVDMPSSGVLGQIAVRIGLSYKRNENPLAYDIYDPKGGMNYRTSWFELSTNELGFNMMPGGSRVNGAGWMSNGLGPNNGSWWLEKGEIYHLFHTAKYITADSQVGIHDNLSTGQGPSWHWYNVRLCRELTDAELGYKLYINIDNYKENYEYTILKLSPKSVDIVKLNIDQDPPNGYFELPKGYLRGFYVKHILNKDKPKSVEQIVEYLKQVDDDVFFDENGEKVPYVKPDASIGYPLLHVYPNPMEHTLHIDLEDFDDKINSIRIHNFFGLQIQQSDNWEHYNEIDVSRLPVGIYILQVVTEKGQARFKLMKK